jgi:phage gpG-like protein
MAIIEVEVRGLKELVASVQELATSVEERNDLANQVGAALFARIRQRFLDKQDPDGKAWPPSRAGLKREAGGYTVRNGKRYTSTGTLFETGALWNSIQLFAASNGEARIGTDIPYSRYLQQGNSRLPKRVFLGFGQSDGEFAALVAKRQMDKLLKDKFE